jgi:hypothetical protein
MGRNTLTDALGAACYEYDRGLLCHVFWLLLIWKWEHPTKSDIYVPVVADIENPVVLFHYGNAYLQGHGQGPGGRLQVSEEDVVGEIIELPV